MPRYYFDVDDQGQMYTDREGINCLNAEEVRTAAIAALPEMAKAVMPDGDHHRITVRVRDGNSEYIYEASLILDAKWTGKRPEPDD